jgi:hypothetical protein
MKPGTQEQGICMQGTPEGIFIDVRVRKMHAERE